MGEVLGTESQEVPTGSVHGFQAELMGQVLVLITQTGKVSVVQSILLIVLRHGIELQEACLSHEDGLYLEEVVTMVANSRKGNVQCPLFKGVAVDAETIVAGQRHEVSILPRAATKLSPPPNVLCLSLQALGLEGSHP